jgi:predicted Zn-dependent protease
MKKSLCFSVLTLISLVLLNGCKKKDDGSSAILDLFFPVSKDKQLGTQLKNEIAANPQQYPILDEVAYPEAYVHIRRIRDSILNTGNVTHANDFSWELKIIHDDEVLNAFAAPGGFIYVYTGLIKYLESEDQLAGVMGHEIAHADRRHSVNQMVKTYGVQVLLDVVLGENQGALTQMAENLVNLKNSRSDESEADKYSVIYLCPTSYNAAGAAGFFVKISAESTGFNPEFLSTHPSPDNRVTDINNHKNAEGCIGAEKEGQYQAILNSLP